MRGRAGLIGRDEEVALIADLLDEAALVTVVGAAGVGKTTIGRDILSRHASDFPDGVHVVELAPLSPGPNLADSIASGLGFGSLDAALVGLRSATALVLLDNCEHLLADVAEIVDRLLDACRDLRVLATSRAPLEIRAEHVLPLRPLGADAACRLLRDRAAEAGARLGDGPETDGELLVLAERVDRLPLALELAGFRLRSLSPGDVVAALDESNDLLRARRAESSVRHSSLSDAIAWSYQLLEPEEADGFCRLSVIETPFSLERASGVLDRSVLDTADLLDRLVSQSLLSPRFGDAKTSYAYLDTVRQFARETLIASDDLDRARDRYLDEVTGAATALIERGATDWSADVVSSAVALAPELLACLRLCLRNDEAPDRAFPLFIPSWGIVHHLHAAEFAALGSALLDRWPDTTAPWWPDVAAIAATAYMRVADRTKATDHAKRALAAGGGLVAEPVARRVLALAHQHVGEWTEALEQIRAGREAGEAIGLPPFAAELEVFEATVVGQSGDIESAIELSTAARIRNVGLQSAPVAAWSMVQEAYLQVERDPNESRLLVERAVTDGQVEYGHWIIPRHLGIIALYRDDLARAATLFRQSLVEARDSGEVPHLWASLRWVGVVAARAGLGRDAGRLLTATESSDRTPAPGKRDADLIAEARDLVASEAGANEPVGADGAVALAIDLLDRLELARESEVVAPSRSATEPAAPVGPRLLADDEGWTLGWQHETARLAPSKGLTDLARLIARPDHEFHAMELMGANVKQSAVDDSVDPEARKQYEQRLRDLQVEIDDATADNDRTRVERAQNEFDLIVEELSKAFGLGGRARTTGGSAEKARSAVTWRVRAAIKKIDQSLPGMARHLRVSVKTGTWCSYQPETALEWTLQ